MAFHVTDTFTHGYSNVSNGDVTVSCPFQACYMHCITSYNFISDSVLVFAFNLTTHQVLAFRRTSRITFSWRVYIRHNFKINVNNQCHREFVSNLKKDFLSQLRYVKSQRKKPFSTSVSYKTFSLFDNSPPPNSRPARYTLI